MTMHQRRRRAGSRRNQERKEVKPEEYTIYERVPALSPGSFDERHMRRNLRITKLYGRAQKTALVKKFLKRLRPDIAGI